MKQKPILDRFEIKGIQSISTLDHRSLTEHHVPGLAGSLFQDLGSEPLRITIQGSLSYEEGRQDVLNLAELRKAFIDGKALPFVADITMATKITEVLITEIEIQESERWLGYFEYRIDLVEHIPEPSEAEVQQEVERDAKERHDDSLEHVVRGEGRLSVTVELEDDDYQGIEVRVEGTTRDGEDFAAVIREQVEGEYLLDHVPEGNYSVTVQSREEEL